MYTPNSTHLKSYRRLKPYIGHLPSRDFCYLDYKLLNVTRDLRKYIAANVNSTVDLALEYSHAKLKLEPQNYQSNFNTQMEVFSEQRQFIRQQIKSSKLKAALMILMTKKMLPNDILVMQLLLKEFNDLFSWKVMQKADEIAKHKT